MFSRSTRRSGTSPGCLMSTTRSHLGRSGMQPLKSWPVRPEWRWQYGSPTRFMIWISMYPANHPSVSSFQYLSCFSSSDLSLSFHSHSVRIIELNGGQSPLTYKRFQTLISRMEAVETPAEAITAEVMGSCTTPVSDDHDEKFGVPSLEELGEFMMLWLTWLE